MNRREADEVAGLLVEGLIEKVFESREPLIYGSLFGEHEGKRMSRDDADRVLEALERIQERCGRLTDARIDAKRGFSAQYLPKVDGKPGARYKKYKRR